MHTHNESSEVVAHPFRRNKRFHNLAGQKLGRFTVISYAGNQKWNCLCECGNTKKVYSSNLRGSKIVSCGCYQTAIRIKHGMAYGSEYISWSLMKQRCYNPKYPRFNDYGGRGITVCERWRDSFKNFIADMGPKPSLKHSIERLENDKNYCAENCTWSTMREQSRNKRNTVRISFNGAPVPLVELAEILGVTKDTLRGRRRNGWTDEEIVAGKRS